PPRVCTICFPTSVTLGVPTSGVRRIAASGVPSSEGFDTFLILTGLAPEADLPTTRARIFNRTRPCESSEIPVIRYSTIRRLNPSSLTFPTATRDASTHTNLVIAEVSAEGAELTVLVEAYTADGLLAGRSQAISLSFSQTREFVDILGLLGVGGLEDGQIRVTKLSGDGLLWGLLATSSDDGRLLISPGMNP